MKRSVTFLLIFSLLALSGNLHAKKKGVELEILKKDGKQVRGELIAVKQSSLLLKESEKGTDESVDITDIGVIKIVKKSKAGTGAIYGGLIGFVLGVIILHATDSELANDPEGGIGANIISGLLGGAGGSLLGAIAGVALIPDKKIQFEGKSDSEIQEILEDLREKARIPDFQ